MKCIQCGQELKRRHKVLLLWSKGAKIPCSKWAGNAQWSKNFENSCEVKSKQWFLTSTSDKYARLKLVLSESGRKLKNETKNKLLSLLTTPGYSGSDFERSKDTNIAYLFSAIGMFLSPLPAFTCRLKRLAESHIQFCSCYRRVKYTSAWWCIFYMANCSSGLYCFNKNKQVC